VPAMDILITPACAQGDAAWASPLSPLWPLDDDYHVDADLCLCGVVCHAALTPSKQLSKAYSVV